MMARSARPTWIQALRAEPGLPPCPADMTEPAWIRLAFEPACDVRQLFFVFFYCIWWRCLIRFV
jgi:hypothetical protein